MKFIKLIFKIIAAPFVVLLTIVTPMIEFVFCYAAALLQVVSGIGVLISIALLISGEKLGFGVDTPFSWFPMLTAPTLIAIFTTILPRWTAPQNFGILSVRPVRCGGSPTVYVLKMRYLLLPIQNATARENSSITGNGSVVISRSPFKRN